MTASKSLPARPSLESLRKQAKKLASDRSLSLRDAQLVLAREYGYAGWQDLTAEVSKRLGKGLEWAVAQAERIIHDDDVERLVGIIADRVRARIGQDPRPLRDKGPAPTDRVVHLPRPHRSR